MGIYRIRVLFYVLIFSFLWNYSNAQIPAFFRTKDNGHKVDTVLIYNPYFPAYTTSLDGMDTQRACPAGEVISFEDENNFAANDCVPINDPSIYTVIVPPTPSKQMYKYIKQASKYPTDAMSMGIHGVVVVEFKLDNNGQVLGVVLYKSLYPSIDIEAMRVIQVMPKWWVDKKSNNFRYRILVKF